MHIVIKDRGLLKINGRIVKGEHSITRFFKDHILEYITKKKLTHYYVNEMVVEHEEGKVTLSITYSSGGKGTIIIKATWTPSEDRLVNRIRLTYHTGYPEFALETLFSYRIDPPFLAKAGVKHTIEYVISYTVTAYATNASLVECGFVEYLKWATVDTEYIGIGDLELLRNGELVARTSPSRKSYFDFCKFSKISYTFYPVETKTYNTLKFRNVVWDYPVPFIFECTNTQEIIERNYNVINIYFTWELKWCCSGVSPYETPWLTSEGWDKIWYFKTPEEVFDFVNHNHNLLDFKDETLYLVKSLHCWGYARRNEPYSKRIAIMFKHPGGKGWGPPGWRDTFIIVTGIRYDIDFDKGIAYLCNDEDVCVEIPRGRTYLLCTEKWCVLVVDYGERKARLYRADTKEQVAEVDVPETAQPNTIELRSYYSRWALGTSYYYWGADMAVDWLALTYVENPSGLDPNDPLWKPPEGWDEICNFTKSEGLCGCSLETFGEKGKYEIDKNILVLYWRECPGYIFTDIYKKGLAEKLAFAFRFRKRIVKLDTSFKSISYGIAHENIYKYITFDFIADKDYVYITDRWGHTRTKVNVNEWYVMYMEYSTGKLKIFDSNKNIVYDGHLTSEEVLPDYANRFLCVGGPGSWTGCLGSVDYTLYLDLDWFAVRYS